MQPKLTLEEKQFNTDNEWLKVLETGKSAKRGVVKEPVPVRFVNTLQRRATGGE